MKSQTSSQNQKKTSLRPSFRSNGQSSFDDPFKDSLENITLNISKDNILIPDSLNNTQVPIQNTNISVRPQLSEEETKKIDYKYITNYPLINTKEKEKQKIFYWFAAYDKLIKKRKLLKILNFYNKKEEPQIIEKPYGISKFDIDFQYDTPYIKPSKNGFLYTKLYYLSLEDINKIFNYINRIEHKLCEETFTFNNSFGNHAKIEHGDMELKYNCLYCLGTFNNTHIYSFSNLNLNPNVQKIKKSKVLKITKYLLATFPTYTKEFIIGYLLTGKSNEFKTSILNKSKSHNNNTDSSIQSINIKNINLNVKVTHVPKIQSNTQYSSMIGSNRNDFTSLSYGNKHTAGKSLNYSKNSKNTAGKRGVYVVSRKMKSDVDFDFDDDSSINTKREKSDKKIYVTPKKKKIPKYYS